MWKGMDTSRKPVFLGYDQVERMLIALLDHASAWHPDEIVAIARGGLVPASMAAGILGKPLSIVSYNRQTNKVEWIGSQATGQRILLIDDCCSTGKTLHEASKALSATGRECLTLAIVYDPETVEYPPALGHPMKELFRLPWERGEATPTGRAARASPTKGVDGSEAPFFGLGFDLGFLAKVQQSPETAPKFVPARSVLIGGVGAQDNAFSTLTNSLYHQIPIAPRPQSLLNETNALARFKAQTATLWGCTHFIECDLEQAVKISGQASHLIVNWWSTKDQQAWIIGAATSDQTIAMKLEEIDYKVTGETTT